MTHAAGPTHWRRALVDVPAWALEDELGRRREAAVCLAAIAVGDDLVVDPVASLVRWRGQDYPLTGRMLDVVYALASAWLGGRRRLRSDTLARAVWVGHAAHHAQGSLWSTVCTLRRRVPGLIAGGGAPGLGYHFPLGYDVAARRVASRRDPA